MKKHPIAHIERPLAVSDIEGWRNKHGLSMADATYALGFPNYKKKLMVPELEFAVELLMRLYDEDPSHGVWPQYRISLPWLYGEMYKDALAVFKGGPHEVTANVDVQARFAKLFGRSKGRAYRWLDETEVDSTISNRTQSTIQAILGKLSQLENPGAALERLSCFIWKLRGEDIDITHPIPTLKNPPTREKRGRRPGVATKVSAKGQPRRSISPDMEIKMKESSAKVLRVKQSLEKPPKAEKVKTVKSRKVASKAEEFTPLKAMIAGKVARVVAAKKALKEAEQKAEKAPANARKGGKNV